jgi:phenylpropionate dioxygenase-like ring-hydroxylating dioxygenase large terminal subunit
MLNHQGWSYVLNGKLAKAPLYDSVETFEKEKNGLFPINAHVDQRGFIWVNLDSSEAPSVSWDSQFKDSDTHPRLEQFNMDDYIFDHT